MITIIGGGMAGLIAGNHFRADAPVIWEAQPFLPDNHGALLRFRSDNVSRVTGIGFKRVQVKKTILCDDQFADQCNPYLANLYSRKVTGEVQDRSIWNMHPAERFIAPDDFISRMASGLSIHYGAPATFGAMASAAADGPVISTIPMPTLMKLANWKDVPDFKWKPIYSANLDIEDPQVDVYQTIHYPDPVLPYYRASITGKKLTIEFVDDPGDDLDEIVGSVALDFGLIPCSFTGSAKMQRQEYGKIVPSCKDACQHFIYTMTRDYGIYSLGRFATWRQLLLDDVVDDCKVIGSLIGAESKRSAYHHSLVLSNKDRLFN